MTLHGRESWLSEEERRVDALALRADERRDKLRKASGRSKYPLIRWYCTGDGVGEQVGARSKKKITGESLIRYLVFTSD